MNIRCPKCEKAYPVVVPFIFKQAFMVRFQCTCGGKVEKQFSFENPASAEELEMVVNAGARGETFNHEERR